MANSIYNELRDNLLNKVDLVNSMLQTKTLSTSETSLLSLELEKVSKRKKELDVTYKELRDYQIKCISMMICTSLIKRFSDRIEKCIFVIDKVNKFYKQLEKIYPYISELVELYVNSSILENDMFENRKNKLISTLTSLSQQFLNISADISDSDCGVFNKDKRYETSVLGVVKEYCELLSKDSFYKYKTSTDDNVVTVFKNRTFENIINSIKNCGRDNILDIDYSNSTVNKTYKEICAYIKVQLKYINELIIPLFNEKNYPIDYVTDVTGKFSEASSYIETIGDSFSSNTDLNSDNNYKQFISAFKEGHLTIKQEFLNAEESLYEIGKLIDRFEMYFNDDTKEYFNKVVSLFLTLVSVSSSLIESFNSTVTDPKEKTNLDDFLKEATPLNFANSKSSLIDESEIEETPYSNNISKSWWRKYILDGLFTPTASQIEDLHKEVGNLLTDKEENPLEETTEPSPITDADEDIPENLKNASFAKIDNLQFADFVNYGIAMLCLEFEYDYPDDFKALKEYFIKKLSLTGFINHSEVDAIGKESWNFLYKFGIAPYRENLNDGIVVASLLRYNFMNDIDMSIFATSKELCNKLDFEDKYNNVTVITKENTIANIDITGEDSENYYYSDNTTSITLPKNDVIELDTISSRNIKEYVERIMTSAFFERNVGLSLRVVKETLKKINDIDSAASLFTKVSSENNFRSKLLSVIIYDMCYKMYYENNKITFAKKFIEIENSLEFINRFLISIDNIEKISSGYLSSILFDNIRSVV